METDFSVGDDAALAVALQSDGKAVVVGAAHTVGSSNFGYIRYNEDGSIEGVATYDFNGKQDQATGVAVLPGGKMILAGFAQSVAGDFDFALLRLNPSGTLDTSFGNNGKVTADFGGGSADYAQAVAVQSDERSFGLRLIVLLKPKQKVSAYKVRVLLTNVKLLSAVYKNRWANFKKLFLV